MDTDPLSAPSHTFTHGAFFFFTISPSIQLTFVSCRASGASGSTLIPTLLVLLCVCVCVCVSRQIPSWNQGIESMRAAIWSHTHLSMKQEIMADGPRCKRRKQANPRRAEVKIERPGKAWKVVVPVEVWCRLEDSAPFPRWIAWANFPAELPLLCLLALPVCLFQSPPLQPWIQIKKYSQGECASCSTQMKKEKKKSFFMLEFLKQNQLFKTS